MAFARSRIGIVGVAAVLMLAATRLGFSGAPASQPSEVDGAKADQALTNPDDSKLPPSTVAEQAMTRGAKLRSLMSTLSCIENQLQLYQLQHQDQWPDLERYPDWEPLTKRTAADGQLGSQQPFGPYLFGPPRNPLTGFHRVMSPTVGRKKPEELKRLQVGFVFDSRRGRLFAIDETGKFLTNPRGSFPQAQISEP